MVDLCFFAHFAKSHKALSNLVVFYVDLEDELNPLQVVVLLLAALPALT